jgi:hypothetical protein
MWPDLWKYLPSTNAANVALDFATEVEKSLIRTLKLFMGLMRLGNFSSCLLTEIPPHMTVFLLLHLVNMSVLIHLCTVA